MDTTPNNKNVLSKDVKYINKDFSTLKQSLIDYAKYYFPNTYKDFNDTSPGTMFIEMAAYVGDVLSYYGDYQFKESFIHLASERKNVINLAKFLGYRIKPSIASTTAIDIFQLIPSKQSADGTYVPDETYCLVLQENTQLSSKSGVSFLIQESVDFSTNTAMSPRETSVYNRDSTGTPQFYLLKKTVKAISAKVVTKTFTVDGATPYLKVELEETNILGILSLTDSDNIKYYEVDYLAQDVVFTEEDNINSNSDTFFNYKSEVPKLIKMIRTPRKFTVNVDSNNITYLEFGANTENFADEIIFPSSKTVGAGLKYLNNINISYDPTNLLKFDTYGVCPTNTTLTITYLVGGGLDANVNSNEITNITSVQFLNDDSSLTEGQTQLLSTVKRSLKVNNPESATGGAESEDTDQIRENSISHFASQNRAVTKEDYIVRVYGMPPQFGSVSKVHVTTNEDSMVSTTDSTSNFSGFLDSSNNVTITNTAVENHLRRKFLDNTNPFSINLYVLGYDLNKNLTTVNEAILYNLKQYLKQYRMLTDKINIVDGFIVNIGVDFKITVYKGYNKKDVSNQCIRKVQEYFDISKWNFSQPINISQIEFEISNIEGVQSVLNVNVKNLVGGNYSPHSYNIDVATVNKIVYPSKDPAIFEVKYPNSDIRCLVI